MAKLTNRTELPSGVVSTDEHPIATTQCVVCGEPVYYFIYSAEGRTRGVERLVPKTHGDPCAWQYEKHGAQIKIAQYERRVDKRNGRKPTHKNPSPEWAGKETQMSNSVANPTKTDLNAITAFGPAKALENLPEEYASMSSVNALGKPFDLTVKQDGAVYFGYHKSKPVFAHLELGTMHKWMLLQCAALAAKQPLVVGRAVSEDQTARRLRDSLVRAGHEVAGEAKKPTKKAPAKAKSVTKGKAKAKAKPKTQKAKKAAKRKVTKKARG